MRLEPIPPGTRIAVTDDLAEPPDAPAKSEARKELESIGPRLEELQRSLFAEGKRAVLVVLQGRDTAGKDGTIRRVFGYLDPQGLSVRSFRAPSADELAHDFLWRIHRATPPRGTVGVFNRSHYEDVLAVRVRGLVAPGVWRARYEQINDFERMLTENGTTVVKFFLHISRAEQRERLLARLEDPGKVWKFDPDDVEARKEWDAYTEAYEDVLALTSTPWAPWYLVPANRKPIRDLLVARVLKEWLEQLDPAPPPGSPDVARYRELLD